MWSHTYKNHNLKESSWRHLYILRFNGKWNFEKHHHRPENWSGDGTTRDCKSSMWKISHVVKIEFHLIHSSMPFNRQWYTKTHTLFKIGEWEGWFMRCFFFIKPPQNVYEKLSQMKCISFWNIFRNFIAVRLTVVYTSCFWKTKSNSLPFFFCHHWIIYLDQEHRNTVFIFFFLFDRWCAVWSLRNVPYLIPKSIIITAENRHRFYFSRKKKKNRKNLLRFPFSSDFIAFDCLLKPVERERKTKIDKSGFFSSFFAFFLLCFLFFFSQSLNTKLF